MLVSGKIKFIFVVDLYNEGVDIPEVNTILFLRPTESLTVFLQQLGRGLRLHEGKECLTVLDFVGQAHKKYNFFEDKFRALIGKSNRSVRENIENGFLTLPKGCYIHLEKQAKEYILRSIKSIKNNEKTLINKIKEFTQNTHLELTLENFLNFNKLSLTDFYGRNKDRSFYRMCVLAGVKEDFKEEQELEIAKKFYKLFFINSRRLIEFIISIIRKNYIDSFYLNEEEKLMLNMIYYIFYDDIPAKVDLASIEDGINKLLKNKIMMKEVCEILTYNYNNIEFVDKKVDLGFPCPLDLHCDYSTEMILTAFGYYNEERKPSFREGVKYFEDKKIDIFFITLNKSDKDFSPSTLYEDYAINENLFHWQSQSGTSVESKTGQRYINHLKNGSKIALFVREYKTKEGFTSPFTYLGTCEYRGHSGSKPISFVWELHEKIPARLINKANKSIII